MRKIGFVGIGNIGTPMARSVLRGGYDLIVCDQNPAALNAFESAGARTTTAAKDLGSEDAVIFMVSSDVQLKEAVLGSVGLLAASNHPRLVIVMSTVLPETVKEIATALAAKKVRVIDAPVSGGPLPAEAGQLTIMVGGETGDLDLARPILETMGKKIYHCGALGTGELTKIVNNLVGVTNQFLVAEALQLAKRSGLDLAYLTTVMDASSGRNFWSRDWRITQEQFAEYTTDLPKQEVFSVRSIKDFKLALLLAEKAGVQMPILEGVTDSVTKMGYQEIFDRFRAVIS